MTKKLIEARQRVMAEEIFERRIATVALVAGSEHLFDEFTELYESLLAVVKEEGREAETAWSDSLEETRLCTSRLKRLRALLIRQTRFAAGIYKRGGIEQEPRP